eukprot:m.100400 g.100400  ORF g.100400 m.100400 type:complete len:63 (+) comp13706_c0_seq1:58-246(+)
MLLDERGIQPNSANRVHGATPLWVACNNRCTETVQAMLRHESVRDGVNQIAVSEILIQGATP